MRQIYLLTLFYLQCISQKKPIKENLFYLESLGRALFNLFILLCVFPFSFQDQYGGRKRSCSKIEIYLYYLLHCFVSYTCLKIRIFNLKKKIIKKKCVGNENVSDDVFLVFTYHDKYFYFIHSKNRLMLQIIISLVIFFLKYFNVYSWFHDDICCQTYFEGEKGKGSVCVIIFSLFQSSY